MGFGEQILFFLSALGAFNGFLLGIYLILISRHPKNYPKLFLGTLLLSLSIRVAMSVSLTFEPNLPLVFPQIGFTALYFTGPSLYYFILSSYQKESFDVRKCNWVFGILAVVILGIGILMPYQSYPTFWHAYMGKFVYGVWTIFMGLSIFRYYQFKNQNLHSSNQLVPSIFYSNILIYICHQLISSGLFDIYCGAGSIVFSFVLYTNFLLIFNKHNKPEEPKDVERYANKKIPTLQAESLMRKLNSMMKEEELYKNPNLKVNEVASKMNLSMHQLSQLLNDNLGKSFSTYVNEFRIEDACQRMIEDPYLKIEEIGYEVGFNSKSTFFSTFKKIKNTTPLLYKQNLTTA